MKTLLLDNSAWDLVLDASGSIAVASEPYSIALGVACAVRTFAGECIYDSRLGLPYWQNILGKLPPLSFIKEKMVDAAKTIPGVSDAKVVFVSLDNRNLTGQIQIVTDAGITQTVTI